MVAGAFDITFEFNWITDERKLSAYNSTNVTISKYFG